MQVHHSIANLPAFKNTVITIGTFDGVHMGHQKIINALQQECEKINGKSVIITFHPHPRKIVQPDKPLQLINTLDEKISLLEKTGIDHLVIVPFDTTFSEQTADEYIENFLIKNFHPSSIIIGYDHHFGKGRTGNYKLLERRAAFLNYNLIEIPQQVLNEIAVSSTKIRNALLKSDISTANELLGYSFFFEGEVVYGDQLGRTLGYPTANLHYTDTDKIHLGHGVYAVYAEVDNKKYKGMLSIGTRPTLNDTVEKVEVNLFGFDKMIYGKNIRVHVKSFLRHQEKYPDLKTMVEQLHRDKEQSLLLL
jgi:riboflavin kinase / FMN adenylyltransferase